MSNTELLESNFSAALHVLTAVTFLPLSSKKNNQTEFLAVLYWILSGKVKNYLQLAPILNALPELKNTEEECSPMNSLN